MSFDRIASAAADHTGRAWAFCLALALVVGWAPSYLLIGDIDTWQLIINTATTIITFLMVFVVQHTQNRDTREIKAMLRALIDEFGLHAQKQAKLEEEHR